MAVTYTRTKHPTDVQVNKLDERIADLVLQLNQAIKSAQDGATSAAKGSIVAVPIGALVWVDLSMTGVPAPGPNFQKCDGSAITDLRSPMKGQNTRDLITAGRFIRAAATSGVVQAADALVPNHKHNLNAHTHAVGTLAFAGNALPGHLHNQTYATATAGAAVQPARDTTHTSATGTPATSSDSAGTPTGTITGATAAPAPADTATDGTSGAETRPVNISMVPYVRIW